MTHTRRLLSLLLLTALAVPVRAQEPDHQAWQAFKAQNPAPGLRVVWDDEARVPRSITGLSLAPPATVKSFDRKPDVLDVSLAFLDRYRDLVQLSTEDVSEKKIRKFQDKWYVTLQTHYRGIPIYHGQVGFSLDQQGRILTYASDYDPRIELDVSPAIDRQRAIELARAHHRPEVDLPASVREAYLIIDRGATDDAEPRLAWYVFLAATAGHRDVDRVFFIDAQSGEVMRDYYPFPNAVSGTIQGQIFPEHSTDAVVTRRFEHATVKVGSASANTNSTGSYSVSPGTGTHTLTTKLEGPFVKVQSYNGKVDKDIVKTLSVKDPATANVSWTAANASPDDGDGLNVFYHANRLHDDYYLGVLGMSWNNPFASNSQMTYSVNRGNGNNAAAGHPITIQGNAVARNSDITFHETTHNVLYDIFSGWVGHPAAFSEGYAFDEGFGDYVACSFNNDSTYAENVHGTRHCDNTMQYAGTAYNTEGHAGGQLVSGVVWDLWNKQGLGHNQADVLAFAGLSQMATLPRPYYFSNPSKSNYLSSILIADDTNSNVGDGTPHDRQIFQAFRNHDLLPVDVFSKDNPSDTGDVPSTGAYWTSPDIWVRNSKDGMTAHQNPIFGQVNYLYVRVRNQGYLKASSTTAKVYWADTAAGIPWPAGWNLIGSTTVTNLAAGSKVVATAIPWTPSGSAIGKRCLKVRLESSQDMITEEANVRLDNNLAQKNITIVKLPPSAPTETEFFLYNRPGARIDVGLRMARVRLDDDGIPLPIEGPRPALVASLEIDGIEGFGELQGVTLEEGDESRFVLQEEGGVIGDLRLGSTDRARVTLRLQATDELAGDDEAFELTIEQRVDGEVAGGLSYIILGDTGKRSAVSFHAGVASPLGTFDTFYDPGLHLSLDVEHRLRPRLFLVGLLGYNRFAGDDALLFEVDDTSWWNLSANLKYRLGSGALRPYVIGGPGIYLPEHGSTELGFNLGLGLDYDLSSTWTLELGGDYHQVFTSGSTTEFAVTALGLIYRF